MCVASSKPGQQPGPHLRHHSPHPTGSYYAKLKRAEDDIMAELAKKYRDRAKERREGDEEGGAGVPEFPNQSEDQMATAGAYRAVAPDLKS